jgi:Ca-activated chloride channel family protein
MNLDIPATLAKALAREGMQVPLNLEYGDLMVHQAEYRSSCATVLMLDVSHSMVLYGEDHITPAKQVAMALAELIETKYPKDSLDVALFGDEARTVSVADLPYVTAGPYHTNTRAALALARTILRRRRHPNRRIVLVTDGKPSALTVGNRIYKNSMGLDPRIVRATLEEAVTCRRERIPITTFMIADDAYLREFVEDLTRVNTGQAFFASPDDLGSAVFVDFLRNRRRKA